MPREITLCDYRTRQGGWAPAGGMVCTCCSSRLSVDPMWGLSVVRPGSGSTVRVSARSSSCGNAGREACTPSGLCMKDLTGVRSRYTRSSSLSLLAATAAGEASSAGSTYRKKSGGVLSPHTLDCRGPGFRSPVPSHAGVSG